MAGPRDQAARVIRDESENAEPVAGGPAATVPALGEQLRSHVEESKRRPGDTPAVEKPAVEKPAVEKPAAAPDGAAAPAAVAPAKSGKRKFILIGFMLMLALAAASYAAYYMLVGRFYISTDDAYVRSNNTMLGARVAGHITAIL